MRMRSLTFKLVLAFLIVSLTGAALSAVFARWATSREFDRLVLEQARAAFIADVSAYYRIAGSWDGVLGSVPARRPLRVASATRTREKTRSSNESDHVDLLENSFILVDRDNIVVVPGEGHQVGDRVSVAGLLQGTPVEVDGLVVGTVLNTARPLTLDPKEASYLARTDRALLLAALIAMAAALVLGVLLARTLAHPLRELTAATRIMAKGHLGQQVPIRSQDELGELAAAFNQMSTDLAHADALRQQMTADIAHELRSPLSVLIGYIEGLRDGVLRPSPARFEVMYNEAQQLKRLIDDLRTLSLADAGELPLTRQPTSPQALMAQVAAAFAHRARQAHLALSVDVDAATPTIDVDPERLVQVLENLVTNALRHTPTGGAVTLAARAEPGAVLLIVADTGEGIPSDVLPHIFDRFYRGDAARTQGGESGLGLAIVKSIVDAHGGAITASSPGPGCGTTFTIRLPA